jgi:signal transduction histidine kinase/ABC-type uncharacterized transport system substrate-binding protein/ActR/RegA family two-component response regulator
MLINRTLKKKIKAFLLCIIVTLDVFSQGLVCYASDTAPDTTSGNTDNSNENSTNETESESNISAIAGKYRVLFLSSYSMNDDACKLELDGIKEALSEDKFEVNYEFMDTRRFNTEYDISILYRYLKNKLYRLPKFDCFIAADDAALSFLMERKDILGDTPVVYFGVQDPKLIKEAKKRSYITGINENYDYKANFDIIKKALPDVKKIKFVTDSSYIGKLDTASFVKEVKEDETFKYDIVNLSERDEKDIESELSSTKDDTVVFLQDMYHINGDRITNFNYMAEKLMPYINVPVFDMSMDATEYGALGGVMYDCGGSAKLAGEMAENIAKGAKASAIQTVEKPPMKTVFNKKVMDKYGISKSELPKDAFYRYDNLSFWDMYKTVIIILSLIFIAMVLVILILYRRTDRQQGLIETDNEIFRQIAREALNFVAVISVTDSTITLRSGTWNYDGSPVADGYRIIPYSLFLDEGARRISLDEKKEVFQRESDLDEIIRILENKETVTNSYDFRTVSDDIRRKQITFMWLNKKQNRILLYETDITKSLKDERKKNKILKEAAEAAKRASEAKTNFISRISHDIRTPIGAILNLTEFAIDDMDDRDKLKDDLDKIGTSGRFLLSLINDVLDISKIDSNKIDLHDEKYLFSDYVSEIENIIEPMCYNKGLHNELNIDDSGMELVMNIDKIRLNQITLNLLSNAVKYTPKGGKVIFSAKITDRLENSGKLKISVKDTGIGMSEEFQKIMFDEFSQEENNPNRVKGTTGTGLGLSIVKRIVELMDGEIFVKSSVELGTEIAVTIPLTNISEISDDENIIQKEKDDLYEPSGKILLAEDNEINGEIASRIFTELGVQVDMVRNGQEELEKFQHEPMGTYSAIFQDIQMPVMNGYEAVEIIRSLNRPDARDIPIIAMTADAFSDAIEKAKKVGMNEFITKPLKRDEIREMLKKYMVHK